MSPGLHPELAALGFLVGMVTGMFGVGGGFFFFPFLSLAHGFSAAAAAATSTAQIPAASLSGIVSHLRARNLVWSWSAYLLIAAIPGALVAAQILVNYRAAAWLEHSIGVLYCLLVGAAGINLIRNNLFISPGVKSDDASRRTPPVAPGWLPIEAALASFFIALTSSFMGIGGGALMVPYLMARLRFSPAQAVAASLFNMFFFSLIAVLRYSFADPSPVDFAVAANIIAGGIPGSFLGARWAGHWSPRKIKLVFGFFEIGVVALFAALRWWL